MSSDLGPRTVSQLFAASPTPIPAKEPVKRIPRSVLRGYYRTLFPFTEIAALLGLAGELRFREFSVTSTASTADMYTRHLSYQSASEWRNATVTRAPDKLDIGAVYNRSPAFHTTHDYAVVDKELVFDIDCSDYQRTCCRDKNVCAHCWNFVLCAMDVCDMLLREEHGFDNIVWVFSGRRGVHAWVLDRHHLARGTGQRGTVVDLIYSVGRRNQTAINLCRKWYVRMFDRVPESDAHALDAMFPRLDRPVTSKSAHLIKSPFCVHPSTGKVCIAMRLEWALTTTPESFPTVWDLDKSEEARERFRESVEMFGQAVGRAAQIDRKSA